MTVQELGAIESVDVARLWGDDRLEFSRWLSENLQLLGEVLHMDLELVRIQPPVGWFDLDILAKEVGSDSTVAIVTQLQRSAHIALGKLPGNAAAQGASVLIWVAPHFRPEHRKTLEWLNEWTDPDIEVYGVESHAIRIGDSPPAIEFRPVVFSSAWAKREGQASSGLSPVAYQRRNFFQPLIEDLWSVGFTNRTAARATSVQSFPSGFPGIFYVAELTPGTARVYLWVSAGEYDKSVRIYDALLQHQAELQSELADLQFDLMGQLGGWRRVSLGMMREGSLNAPDGELAEIREWMRDNLLNLKAAVQPFLEQVMDELSDDDADDADETGDAGFDALPNDGPGYTADTPDVNSIDGQQEGN